MVVITCLKLAIYSTTIYFNVISLFNTNTLFWLKRVIRPPRRNIIVLFQYQSPKSGTVSSVVNRLDVSIHCPLPYVFEQRDLEHVVVDLREVKYINNCHAKVKFKFCA